MEEFEHRRSALASAGVWLTVQILRVLFGLYFKLFHSIRYRGRENLLEAQRAAARGEAPLLVAPNHQSFYDGFLTGVPMRPFFYFMIEASYFKPAILKWVLLTMGGVPVIRGERGDPLRVMIETLRSGKTLIVYPEGHRSRNGSLLRLRSGCARAAVASGATIVPLSMAGAFDAWPRHRKLPRLFTPMVLEHHRPIHCPRLPDDSPPEEVQAHVDQVLARLDQVLRRRLEAWKRLRARKARRRT